MQHSAFDLIGLTLLILTPDIYCEVYQCIERIIIWLGNSTPCFCFMTHIAQSDLNFPIPLKQFHHRLLSILSGSLACGTSGSEETLVHLPWGKP